MSDQMESPEPTEVESGGTEVVSQPLPRILALITNPVAAMRGAAAGKSDWWVPLIVVLVSLVLFNLLASDVLMDFGAQQMRERMSEMVANGQLTQDRADQIIEQQTNGNAMKIGVWVGPAVNVFIMRFVFTLLALLVGNVILGGGAKFGVYWNVIWWAAIISGLGMILSGFLMNMTGDIQGAQLGLGVLTKANPDSTLHKILQIFNVFAIWEAVVMGFGVAAAAKVKESKGVIWMLVVYLGLSLTMSLAFGQAM